MPGLEAGRSLTGAIPTRGQCPRHRLGTGRGGTIPAGAGSPRRAGGRTARPWDHPCGRGVDHIEPSGTAFGESPARTPTPQAPSHLRPARRSLPRRSANVARPRRAGSAVTAATEFRPHQREAVDAVVRAPELSAAQTIPERGMRTLVVMARGSGKTLVAARSSDELHARQVLMLAPSLDLLAQTEAAWREGAAAGAGAPRVPPDPEHLRDQPVRRDRRDRSDQACPGQPGVLPTPAGP
ncbi:DEAD/DEAH box helicase family protein [Streptomyces avidinii]|uniref:DEAD/DEAH box helicase family protein n=1 Tax=Streptomyces avidinii TaxID=1895 RepID=UPI0037AB54F2